MEASRFSGEALLEWRTLKGWKRTYLAQLLRVSVTTLWSWERLEFVPVVVALACRAIDSNLKPMGEE